VGRHGLQWPSDAQDARVEAGGDLASWTQVWASDGGDQTHRVTITDNGDGTDTIVVRDNTPADAARARFITLRVVRP